MKRLAQGGLVDRTRILSFYFDGKAYKGYPGDSLASALLASNVRLVGRSFKYHRPRGIVTAGCEEPCALAEIGQTSHCMPNSRMTTEVLYDGLYAKAQNAFPSVRYDFGAVNNLLGRFLGAGFYYKTFMGYRRNTKFWMLCEKIIRKAAGLGKAPRKDDRSYFEHFNEHVDLLVIGGGVSGIWSAYQAGLKGLKVILAEQNAIMGSQLFGQTDRVDNLPVYEWTQRLLDKMYHMDNVTLLSSSTVFGFFDGNIAGMLQKVGRTGAQRQHRPDVNGAPKTCEEGIPYERRWKIYYQQALVTTGAQERHLVFGNNDLPGVMLAGAVTRYINEYAVLPADKRAVVFTNNSYAYQTAFDLKEHGINVSIVDSRPFDDKIGAWVDRARGLGITVHCGSVVTHATGRKRIKSVVVRGYDAKNGTLDRKQYHMIDADLLAVSGGFTPTIQLLCHLGAKVTIQNDTLTLPDAKNAPAFVAGMAASQHGLQAVLQSAHQTIQKILAEFKHKTEMRLPVIEEYSPYSVATPLWQVPHLGNDNVKKFVDLQHDVTAKDLSQAVDEGYVHAEHAKRYSTASMATDQAKISGMNIAGILAQSRGADIGQVGLTSWRPPFTPVSIGAFAGSLRGKHLQPTRKTPIDAWHRDNGGAMVEAGLWMRPRYYRQHGRNINEAYVYEMQRVRKYVGICDVSTLGKIDIAGPDAAEFLNRVYANKFLKLPVGKARYGVMLKEDGMIMDDGTCARIDDNHFYMTTTTAQAGSVMHHLEYCLSVLWPNLQVRLSSITDQWAAISLGGPLARDILSQLTVDDVSNEALPFMGVKELYCKDMPVRVLRISFSGELAYELHTPARYGMALWKTMLKVGGKKIIPYGTEALVSLRIEKGHIAGAEITGHTTLRDVGLHGMAGKDKDYIGKMMSQRAGLDHDQREQIVGIKMKRNQRAVRGGATVLLKDKKLITQQAAIGRITSFCYSSVLNQNIALALVTNGRQLEGQKVLLKDFVRGVHSEGEICSAHFYDPKGEKLHG